MNKDQRETLDGRLYNLIEELRGAWSRIGDCTQRQIGEGYEIGAYEKKEFRLIEHDLLNALNRAKTLATFNQDQIQRVKPNAK